MELKLYTLNPSVSYLELIPFFKKSDSPQIGNMWSDIEPIPEHFVRLHQKIAPFAIFEFLSTNTKIRKIILKFYQNNQSDIDSTIEKIESNDKDIRNHWCDFQIKNSFFYDLKEQKAIRDVIIFISQYPEDIQVLNLIQQTFPKISHWVKIHSENKKSFKKNGITEESIKQLNDFEMKILYTNLLKRSIPQFLSNSEIISNKDVQNWYSYVFVKSYIPQIKLPHVILIQHEHNQNILSRAGFKFLESDYLNRYMEPEKQKNLKKTKEFNIGNLLLKIKPNTTLNNVLDDLTSNSSKEILKVMRDSIIFELKMSNSHDDLSNQTKKLLKEYIAKRIAILHSQKNIIEFSEHNRAINEIVNQPLTEDDITALKSSMNLYKKIIAEAFEDIEIQDYQKTSLEIIHLINSAIIILSKKTQNNQVLKIEKIKTIEPDKELIQQIESLKKQLDDKSEQLLKVSKQASRTETLQQQLQESQNQIKDLETQLQNIEPIVVTHYSDESTLNLDEIELRLNSENVTFIGGHQNWIANTKKWAPKANYIEPHEAARKIPDKTKILIVITGYLNHGMFEHTKNAYKQLKDCQMIYLNSQSTNKNIVLRDLGQQLK